MDRKEDPNISECALAHLASGFLLTYNPAHFNNTPISKIVDQLSSLVSLLLVSGLKQVDQQMKTLAAQMHKGLPYHFDWNLGEGTICALTKGNEALVAGHYNSVVQLFLEQASKARHNSKLAKNTFRWVKQVCTQQNKLHWLNRLEHDIRDGAFSKVSYSERRISKRYNTSPGLKIKKDPALIIAIDVSASIPDNILSYFNKEAQRLLKLYTNSLLVYCDDEVRATSRQLIRSNLSLKGSGSTNYEPLIRFANAQKSGDHIFYFTDGKCDAPKIRSVLPLTWLIYNDTSASVSHLSGKLIRLDNYHYF